jgi:two-component system, LytTR family, response regulator
MSNPQHILLTDMHTRTIRNIIIGTLYGVAFYQLINLLSPKHGELKPLFEGQYKVYFKDLVTFYLIFEPISVFIFFQLLHLYVKTFKLEKIHADKRSLFVYLVKLLPLILSSIFIFAPITNGIRYLCLHYPDWSWDVYFPEYFFTATMYQKYLVPLFFFGYLYLGYDLFLDYVDWTKSRVKEKYINPIIEQNKYLKQIEAIDNQGDTVLKVADVMYFEVENKSYLAFTKNDNFRIHQTISELEEALDPKQFFRVNRSQIINLGYFKNYSFWENDKYIVRLNDCKTEFVMQRTRMKDLKGRL